MCSNSYTKQASAIGCCEATHIYRLIWPHGSQAANIRYTCMESTKFEPLPKMLAPQLVKISLYVRGGQ